MIKFLILFCVLFLVSCEQKDKQFCKCLRVSEAFNLKNQEILGGKIDEKTMKEAVRLKKEKVKTCFDYVNMTGEEMMARKKECN
jgi:hypothetical protein